jgi:FlaA1/EpsC-like NDP-sugar epimerase
MLADALATSLAVILAVSVGGGDISGPAALPLVLLPAIAMLTVAARGLYGRRVRVSVLDEAPALAGAISVAAMLVIVVQELASAASGASLTVAAWALAVAFSVAGRATLASTQRRLRQRGGSTVPTLIVGAGVVGRQVADRLRNSPEYGLVPVGYVDSNPKDADGSGLLPVLGSLAELPLVIHHSRIGHVIFAFTSATDESLVPHVRRCEALGLDVSIVPRFFESTTDRMAMERIGSLPLLGLRSADRARRQGHLKRSRAVRSAPYRPRRAGVQHLQVPLDARRRGSRIGRCAAQAGDGPGRGRGQRPPDVDRALPAPDLARRAAAAAQRAPR